MASYDRKVREVVRPSPDVLRAIQGARLDLDYKSFKEEAEKMANLPPEYLEQLESQLHGTSEADQLGVAIRLSERTHAEHQKRIHEEAAKKEKEEREKRDREIFEGPRANVIAEMVKNFMEIGMVTNAGDARMLALQIVNED